MMFPAIGPTEFIVGCAVLGLLVGSFLNVVIHRLPKMLEQEWHASCAEMRGEPAPHDDRITLSRPRSRCPHCGHQITAIENVPVVSYLMLKGRCSHCKARIGMRYPAIEILSATLSGFAAFHFGAGWIAIASLVFIWTLLALTFIDLDTQLLPDALTLPLLWAGLLVNLGATHVDLRSAVVGAAAGYLTLWSVYWLFKLATGKEGMGFGDFKLLAAIGAWLGWQQLPLTILLSSVVGAIIGLGLIAIAKRGREIPMPFGPYLAIAGMIALFWGKDLTRTYLGLLG
jgi:leader peptidase (prepilin peptidase)/N-methyltransferase